MGKYKITKEASEDLINIFLFGIDKFGLTQANSYHDDIEECFENLSNRPYIYQKVEHLSGDYRRCVYKSSTIYFLVLNDEILIVRIIGMQDTKNGFSG